MKRRPAAMWLAAMVCAAAIWAAWAVTRPAGAAEHGGFVTAGAAYRGEDPSAGTTRRVRPVQTVLHQPATVPMEMVSGLPVVRVRLDGQGPFMFLLDTGASCLTVSEDLAKRLKLPAVTGTKITSVSPVASMDLGHPRTVRELAVGSAVFRDIDAAAADLSSLQMGPLDGILGLAVFADCRLTLDYPAKQVIVAPSNAPAPPARPDEVLPAQWLGGMLLTVPVKVQDQTLWCLLDSGSNGRLTVPADEAERLPVAATATYETTSHMFGGTQSATKLARLACSAYLGRWELARPIIDVVDHDQLILGSGILEHFVVTIDVQAMTVSLTRQGNDPIPSPPPFKTLGVTLVRQGRAWVVTGPQPGVQMDSLGLKVEDKILRIDKQPVTSLSRARLDEMMRQSDTLNLELDRKGRRMSLQLALTVLIP